MKSSVLVALALTVAATALPAPSSSGSTNVARAGGKGGKGNAKNAGADLAAAKLAQGKGGAAAKDAAGKGAAANGAGAADAANAKGAAAADAANAKGAAAVVGDAAAAKANAAGKAGDAAAAAKGAAAAGGNAQTSLTLDPAVVAKGFAQDGQAVADPGQVPSLTSTNNFINFCLTVPQLAIMNGKQIKDGACNPAPMGAIPSTKNMPSSKFTFPKNGQTIAADKPFTISMAIQNLETGNFVNAQTNYYSAPQQLNAQGQIIGHSHVVVEKLSAIDQTTPTDPNVFAFFKGLNAKAKGGVLTADVAKGLPAGVYRLASINAAANHQPALAPVAQHGSLDDAVYFTCSSDAAAVAASDAGANALDAAAGKGAAAAAAGKGAAADAAAAKDAAAAGKGAAADAAAAKDAAAAGKGAAADAAAAKDAAAAGKGAAADAAAAKDAAAAGKGAAGKGANAAKGVAAKGGAAGNKGGKGGKA